MKNTKQNFTGIIALVIASALLQACSKDQASDITSDQINSSLDAIETTALEETPATTHVDFGEAEINFMIDTVIQWKDKNDLGSG